MILQDFVILIALILLCTKYEFLHALKGGRSNVRNARGGEFPFVVAILNLYEDEGEIKSELECTGTVLTRSFTLTAAHCLEGKDVTDIRVLTGTIDLVTGTLYNVSWWTTYKEWVDSEQIELSTDGKENDIAIFQVSVHTLPVTSEILSPLTPARFGRLKFTLVGWSLVQENCGPMKTGRVKPTGTRKCKKKALDETAEISQFEERFFCTSRSRPILLDYGDSGGPVLYENKVVGINVGTCPQNEEPNEKVNFHVAINFYRPFIDSICALESQ